MNTIARRVVVTGLGICCPLGTDVQMVWKKILAGQSGIVSVQKMPGFEQIPSKVAGFVPRGSGPGEFQEND